MYLLLASGTLLIGLGGVAVALPWLRVGAIGVVKLDDRYSREFLCDKGTQGVKFWSGSKVGIPLSV